MENQEGSSTSGRAFGRVEGLEIDGLRLKHSRLEEAPEREYCSFDMYTLVAVTIRLRFDRILAVLLLDPLAAKYHRFSSAITASHLSPSHSSASSLFDSLPIESELRALS